MKASPLERMHWIARSVPSLPSRSTCQVFHGLFSRSSSAHNPGWSHLARSPLPLTFGPGAVSGGRQCCGLSTRARPAEDKKKTS